MEFFKKVMHTVGVNTGLAPGFPYELNPGPSNSHSNTNVDGIWNIHSGQHSSTKAVPPPISSNAGPAARNAVKRLKTLRHPKILRFVESAETDSRIFIATEPAVPLAHLIDQVRSDPEWLLWICYNLFRALQFLHQEAQMIHGNIRLTSIFITPSGEAKLGGFELAALVNDQDSLMPDFKRCFPRANLGDWPVELVSAHSSPSWRQIQSYKLVPISQSFLSFFHLRNVLTFLFDNSAGQIMMHSTMPPPLLAFCRDALHNDPTRRPNPARFIDSTMGQPIFKTKLISFAERVEYLSGLKMVERDELFKCLVDVVDELPQRFVTQKILPELTKLFQLPEAISLEAIKLVLKISPLVSDRDFSTTLIPLLTLFFQKSDRAIRLLLLDRLETFVDRLPSKLIQDSLFAYIAAGFTDGMPTLREQTLKASLVLAPKLTSRVLNNDLLRFYAKLQMDEQPGIRVNTVVCLGKISKYLDTRQRVLGMAFCRSLHDPFVPCRHAALVAIAATMDCFLIEDIARSIVPTVAPLLVDRERRVREQAFKTCSSAIRKLDQHSKTLPDLSTTETAGATSQGQPTPEKLSEDRKDSGAWLNWSLGTITQKIVSTTLGDKSEAFSDTISTLSSSATDSSVRSKQSKRNSLVLSKLTGATNFTTIAKSEKSLAVDKPRGTVAFKEERGSGWDDGDLDELDAELASNNFPAIPGIEASPVIRFSPSPEIGSISSVAPSEIDAWSFGRNIINVDYSTNVDGNMPNSTRYNQPGSIDEDEINDDSNMAFDGWGQDLSGGEETWGDLKGQLPTFSKVLAKGEEKLGVPSFSGKKIGTKEEKLVETKVPHQSKFKTSTKASSANNGSKPMNLSKRQSDFGGTKK